MQVQGVGVIFFGYLGPGADAGEIFCYFFNWCGLRPQCFFCSDLQISARKSAQINFHFLKSAQI